MFARKLLATVAAIAFAMFALLSASGVQSYTAKAAGETTQTLSLDTTSTPNIAVPPAPKPKPITPPTTKKPVVKTPVKNVVKAPAKPTITPVKFRRNLSVGSRGDDVLYLQRRLTELGYLPGSLTGRFTSHTRHAVIAFQKVNGLSRDGVVRSATYAQLAKPKTISLRYPSGNHVEINKKYQVLVIVRNGKAKYVASTSTGSSKHPTPTVSSAVDWKAGAKYVSKKYGGIMNWPSFFYGGVAVHGYSSVPPYPASHGCARVPVDDAKFIHSNMPKGSMVYVY